MLIMEKEGVLPQNSTYAVHLSSVAPSPAMWLLWFTLFVVACSFSSRFLIRVWIQNDNTLKVWSFEGLVNDSKKAINSVAVSPDDNFVCSGSQVWALAIGRKTEMLATGGSDAVINIWNEV
ncbi:uncharacterized protein LOC141599231 [Silene latifolia]|uniref:uncharacterized protein LOC141599231 n=1 Tax=Silene latifolia TaxID=37657 RepID=UPI003D7753BB